MRGLGQRQIITPISRSDDNRDSQSRGFRPLFDIPAQESGLTPATLREPVVVGPPQPDPQRLQEEWAAKLEEVDQALRQARHLD